MARFGGFVMHKCPVCGQRKAADNPTAWCVISRPAKIANPGNADWHAAIRDVEFPQGTKICARHNIIPRGQA